MALTISSQIGQSLLTNANFYCSNHVNQCDTTIMSLHL